jgi:hypothetical protein
MINIGTAHFSIAVRALPEAELKVYSSELFDVWETRLAEGLLIPDYSLHLEIEEGSLKGRGKVLATLGAIYIGIGNYGGFVDGVQAIATSVRTAGGLLRDRAVAPFDSKSPQIRFRRDAGKIGQIEKLFVRVQRGDLEPEAAAREAEALFEDEDAASSPEFMTSLRSSIAGMPRYPHQLCLPLDAQYLNDEALPPEPKRSPARQPKPVVPPPQRLRIEIWRDSKKGPRLVSVSTL